MHNYLYQKYNKPSPGDLVCCSPNNKELVIVTSKKVKFNGHKGYRTIPCRGTYTNTFMVFATDTPDYYPYYPPLSIEVNDAQLSSN